MQDARRIDAGLASVPSGRQGAGRAAAGAFVLGQALAIGMEGDAGVAVPVTAARAAAAAGLAGAAAAPAARAQAAPERAPARPQATELLRDAGRAPGPGQEPVPLSAGRGGARWAAEPANAGGAARHGASGASETHPGGRGAPQEAGEPGAGVAWLAGCFRGWPHACLCPPAGPPGSRERPGAPTAAARDAAAALAPEGAGGAGRRERPPEGSLASDGEARGRRSGANPSGPYWEGYPHAPYSGNARGDPAGGRDARSHGSGAAGAPRAPDPDRAPAPAQRAPPPRGGRSPTHSSSASPEPRAPARSPKPDRPRSRRGSPGIRSRSRSRCGPGRRSAGAPDRAAPSDGAPRPGGAWRDRPGRLPERERLGLAHQDRRETLGARSDQRREQEGRLAERGAADASGGRAPEARPREDPREHGRGRGAREGDARPDPRGGLEGVRERSDLGPERSYARDAERSNERGPSSARERERGLSAMRERERGLSSARERERGTHDGMSRERGSQPWEQRKAGVAAREGVLRAGSERAGSMRLAEREGSREARAPAAPPRPPTRPLTNPGLEVRSVRCMFQQCALSAVLAPAAWRLREGAAMCNAARNVREVAASCVQGCTV